MQKWNGQLLRKFDDDTEGNASVGTAVVVRNKSDNTIAVIYDVDDTNSIQKNNPFVTDAFGRYSFFAPDGKYIIEFGDGSDSIEVSLNDSNDILAPFGLDSLGNWVDLQEFTAYNQYMIFGGEAYSPLPATNLPYTVGAAPDLGFVYQIKLNSLQALSGLTEPSDLDSVHSRNFKTVSDLKSGIDASGSAIDMSLLVGSRVLWRGYYAESDGGSNWGMVKTGAHTEDGGSIFSIDATTYVEANIRGSKLNALKFGVTRDDVDTIIRSQVFYDYCNDNNFTMYYPAGIYNHSAPINPNNTRNYDTITLEGDSAGDAYGVIGVGGVTVFHCNGADLFYQPEIYDENSSVSISKIKMFGSDVAGLEKKGWIFHVNGTVNRQLNNFWLTDITCHLNAGIYKQTSTIANTNAPYFTLTRAYTWRTDQIVSLDVNTISTIFTVKDSLFHSTASNAMDFLRGGELSLINVWFESCNQYAINCPNNNFFNLSMHNVDFENTSAIGFPERRIWNVSANTRIAITGKMNTAFYQDSPPDLPPNARLSNNSVRTLLITSSGGIVETPSTVRLDRKGPSTVYIPLSSYTDGGSNIELYPDSLNGGVDGFIEYDTEMPVSLQNQFAPISGARVARGLATIPTPASDGWAVLSFVFQGGSVNGGFNVGSSFTISAGNVPFNTSINAPNDSDKAPYIVVQAAPILAIESIDSVIADVRSRKFLSAPSFLFTERDFLSDMLPAAGRKKSFDLEVTTLGKTMLIPLGSDSPFYHKVDINFPDGDGSATFHSSGKVGASEHRITTVSDNTSAVLTLATDTTNAVGSTRIGITNTSGITKTALVVVEY